LHPENDTGKNIKVNTYKNIKYNFANKRDKNLPSLIKIEVTLKIYAARSSKSPHSPPHVSSEKQHGGGDSRDQ
jgi:hypothetical protein